MPRAAVVLALLLLVPLASAALPGPLAPVMGPRPVRYVSTQDVTMLPCTVGLGPADVNGACWWFERTAGDRLVLRASDDAGPGALAIFLMNDNDRGGTTLCVGQEGVEIGAWSKLMAWIQPTARCGRAPTTGTLDLAFA